MSDSDYELEPTEKCCEIMGWCACGMPEKAVEALVQYLKAVEWAWEDRMERGSDVAEKAGIPNDGLFYLVAYIADERGLTEHGGSVGGAWLTDKGRDFIKLAEQIEQED